MNNLTPLTRPVQSQVTIDPIAKDCPSEGFNYPTFPQLNKQSRVKFSQPLSPDPSIPHRLFATANIKEWFVSVIADSSSSSELIFSSLEHLRSAFNAAKEEDQDFFTPKRRLPLAFGKVNIVTFAYHDTRLLVGFERGAVAIYDTGLLFTAGSGDVQPLRISQLQSGPLRQIVSNPGTEQNLSNLVAVVGDGKAVLLDMQLEPQGGWTASDSLTQPVAAAWSPKGKHIAIGLQTGDILTFSLNNKSAPHKHIPPTADAILVSLNWLGPGHIFRTSYGAKSDAPAKQHIITLDTKSSMATYIAPDHPFPNFDRNQQSAYVLCLPRWDEDAPGEGNKSLVVVGDISSVDLEVLGNIGNIWYRQSQENPLTLPLDKAMDDTILLALDIDLTDTNAGTPVMYAYLNDGTLQGWQVKHSKPYIGMVSAQGLAPTFSQSSIQSQESGPKDSDMSGLSSTTETSPFAQSSGNNTPFGQQASSSFGQQQSSTFEQSPFNDGTMQGWQVKESKPYIGMVSTQGLAPTFSQLSVQSQESGSKDSDMSGEISPFAPMSGNDALFGQQTTPSFGQQQSSAFGQSPFGQPPSQNASVFGQSPFGQLSSSSPSAFSPSSTSGPFGQTNTATSSFGSSVANPNDTPSTPPASTSNAFSNIQVSPSAFKPAAGFGAFGSAVASSTSPFFKKPDDKSPVSAFGSLLPQGTSSTTPVSTPTFGSPSALGGPKSVFAPQSSPSPTVLKPTTSDGFGAFSGSMSGFSAFTGPKKSFSELLKTSDPDPVKPSTPPALFGQQTTSSFVQQQSSAFGQSPFGQQSSQNASVFGQSSFGQLPSSAPSAFSPPSTSGPFGQTNTATSSFGSSVANPLNDRSPTPPAPSSNAFSNIQVSPSAFKPAAGFGAFGSAVTASPFFKKPDDKPPPVSAFGSLPPQGTPSTTPVSTPTFGSPSALGGPKSVFAPSSPSSTALKPTTSDGFGAFSGSMGGFSAFAGPKKSFSELLKTSDSDTVKTSTPLAFSTLSSKDVLEKTTPKAVTPISGSASGSSSKKEEDAKDDKQKTPKSVFSVLSAPVGDVDVDGTSNAAVSDDGDKKQVLKSISSGTISDEPSYGIISGSSAASSFVDINAEQESDGNVEEEDTDDGGEDGANAFLSEDASSDGSYEDQESAEESSTTEDSESNDSPPLGPAAIPLPISRSPSATPQPEIPTIEISPSPPSEEKSYRSSSSPARDSSTTPPGTPAKVSKPLFDSSPSPTGNVLIPSLSGIGLGRPSTRPARSSPLANAVLSGHDEDDEDKAKSFQPPVVAPKSVFNTIPLKVEVESSEGQSPADKRPKTPPLSSTMGGTVFFASKSSTAPVENPKVDTPAPLSFQKPPAMAPPSVFGIPPQVPSGPSPFPPMTAIQPPASAATPVHSTYFGIPPPASSLNTSAFNIPPANPQTSITSIPLTSAPQGLVRPSPFPPIPISTSGPSPSTGSPSFFAAPNQPTPSSQLKAPPTGSFAPSPAFSAPQKSPAETAAQVALEEGMQKECIYSVSLADNELEEMVGYIISARKKFEEVATSRGGSQYRGDLSDPSKWGLGDLTQFSQVLRQYEGELDNLTAQSETETQTLREIRSNMLKAGTRREEIARFSRVKTDQEFAKILKARTLGPEHSETQMQLRKCIRLVHDRVQKLETCLQEKKKKLAESISGKPSFKAPSLDTINRSYQNIDRIINERNDQVSDLAVRISRLNTKDVANSPQQDYRLGDSGSGRPYNVTPDVAATTAAALNAERSAQRLKKALLAVRKEPLLNTKAASTPNIRLMTPQKPSNRKPSAFPALLPPSPTSSSSTSMLDWTSLPEDNFNPNAVPSPPSRRGGGGGQRKHQSVPLKRSAGPSEASAATAPSFDWGPLPSFPSSPGMAKTTVPTAFVPFSTTIMTPLSK